MLLSSDALRANKPMQRTRYSGLRPLPPAADAGRWVGARAIPGAQWLGFRAAPTQRGGSSRRFWAALMTGQRVANASGQGKQERTKTPRRHARRPTVAGTAPLRVPLRGFGP
jgi:hypothetical protein